jgi:hypothetical protein
MDSFRTESTKLTVSGHFDDYIMILVCRQSGFLSCTMMILLVSLEKKIRCCWSIMWLMVVFFAAQVAMP